MHELLIVKRQHLERFSIQLEAGATVVKRLHPRKKFGIEKDGVGMGGKLGRFDALHLVQGRIGIGLHHAEECVAHPVQHAA